MTCYCPVDNCEYSAEKIGSVKAHITRGTKDGHKGKSGPNMADKITTDSDGADSSVTGADSDAGNDALSFPEADSADSGASADCPNCDGGSLSELPTGTGFTTDDGRRGKTTDGDCLCEGCDAVVTPDGEVFK